MIIRKTPNTGCAQRHAAFLLPIRGQCRQGVLPRHFAWRKLRVCSSARHRMMADLHRSGNPLGFPFHLLCTVTTFIFQGNITTIFIFYSGFEPNSASPVPGGTAAARTSARAPGSRADAGAAGGAGVDDDADFPEVNDDADNEGDFDYPDGDDFDN